MAKRARGKSRVVPAPEPELMAGQLAPNRVLAVKLKPGEDVEWLWTLLPLGGRYVSGYRIVRVSALERLPADVVVHPKLVVGRKSGEAMLKATRTGEPTKALRELMR